jgi:membrane-associated protein
MNQLQKVIDLFLHLDKHLSAVFVEFGGWIYVLLFLIIFCETGLVITPFLPGDSLLFAAGALAASAKDTPLNIHLLALLLFIAAVIGDGVNYFIGSMLGEKAFTKYPRIFRKEYLNKTSRFYEKYGGKTIIFARFIPIVRTFAPFLAGVGTMNYSRFFIYNIVGAFFWVGIFLYGGYIFGNIPAVKSNFSLLILGIIFVSVLPIAIEFIKARKNRD